MKIIQKIFNILFSVTKYNDVLLSFLLITIISLLIIPLPTTIVDGLIVVNLTMAIMMVILSLYITNVISFSVFPSLLLFTTLFRLSLSIATTRLILLNADAGDIIYTFGDFVVAGNFVVGTVIFLILTIVQFVVIAKGSERVAEVAARFSLDGMPGKQMSIDADVKAGHIKQIDAIARRRLLAKESQMYGSMDGAMKFVKGDAIAGIIITIVNIIGGLAIGIGQKNMAVSDALQTYSILTIGDGLVAQIPALLISITSGIVVTRVADSEDTTNLAVEIRDQFFAQPKAILIGSSIVFFFGLVPGFPKVHFFMAGLFCCAIGLTVRRLSVEKIQNEEKVKVGDPIKKALASDSVRVGDVASSKEKDGTDPFLVTKPLMAEINKDVEESIDTEILIPAITKIRESLYRDFGVPFPGLDLSFTTDIPPRQYKIYMDDIPAADGYLMEGKLLALEDENNLQNIGIAWERGEDFMSNLPAIWVNGSYKEKLEEAEIKYLNHSQILSHHVSKVLRRHAADFIGIQETRMLLNFMDKKYPDLSQEAQRVVPLQVMTEIFQRLVREEISIRNMRIIFECLVEWGEKVKGAEILTEYVRVALKRYISYKYSNKKNVLSAYILDNNVEEHIRGSIKETEAGSFLDIDPITSETLLEAIKTETSDSRSRGAKSVLLTSKDVRPHLRKIMLGMQELYELPVVSYQELTQEVQIQTLGNIKI